MQRESQAARVTRSRSPAPANRELRAQGVRTRAMIVRAATKLLLESGSLDFTLRAVARQAKISVSNLQYYFPDRQELLRAVMAPFIETYFADLEGAVNSGASPRETIFALVDRQWHDVNDSKFRVLWWHFSQMASIDPECSRLFDEWFETLAHGVARLVARINPELGPAASMQLAMLIIAMGNGLSFQVQAGQKRNFTRGLGDSYRAMVDFLLHHNPMLGSKSAAQAEKR